MNKLYIQSLIGNQLCLTHVVKLAISQGRVETNNYILCVNVSLGEESLLWPYLHEF